MPSRLVAIGALATASIAAASMALATPSAPHAQDSAAPVVHYRTQLRYTFDRGETLRPGSLVHDVSGDRHAGRVLVADRGHLSIVPGIHRRGAGYPINCPTCEPSGRTERKAIIEARDRIGLDPRRHPFFFGVAVKLTRFQALGDSNLVQKGFYNTPGGQYKLQLADGVPSCVVFGGRGRLIVESTKSVADGSWHALSCRRTRGAVALRVDRRLVGRLTGRTGLVANDQPLRVGGKNLQAGNDQYHGDLDNVFLRIKQ